MGNIHYFFLEAPTKKDIRQRKLYINISFFTLYDFLNWAQLLGFWYVAQAQAKPLIRESQSSKSKKHNGPSLAYWNIVLPANVANVSHSLMETDTAASVSTAHFELMDPNCSQSVSSKKKYCKVRSYLWMWITNLINVMNQNFIMKKKSNRLPY